MISEFENLSLGGTNAASNHGDPFTHAELTPEQQKALIDIRRRKTELLLEIQLIQSGQVPLRRSDGSHSTPNPGSWSRRKPGPRVREHNRDINDKMTKL